MKIAIECQSPLLQKSLEIFLERYLCSNKHSDIVIRDKECLEDPRCFYISTNENADLKKPFSKAQLILVLENTYTKMTNDTREERRKIREDEPLDFEILEKRIDYLTQQYQENIMNAVKAFYEK